MANIQSIITNGNGNVLIGTTTDNGFRLNVSGTQYVSGNVSIGTTYNGFALNVAGTTYVIGASVWVQNGYGYVNSGSTNTGLFPMSDHNIEFRNNNTTNVIFNASGNVGIGTTAPQSKLQVARAGNANGGTILMGVGGSGTSKWSFLAGTHYNQATGSGNGSGSAGVAIIGADATETSNAVYIGGGPYEINPATVILFNTYTATTHNLGGLERMRITSDGNVLIGTSTDSGIKLDVNGTGRFSGGVLYLGNFSGNPELTLQATQNSWSKINFYDNNNTEGLYIRTDGDVYGGTMTFGARWDDDEGKVFFKMFQSSAGAAYDVKMGVNTGSPETMLHLAKSSSSNDISGTPSIIITNRDATSGTFVSGGIFNNPYRDVSTSSVTAGVWFENQNSPDAGSAAKSSDLVFGANSYSANWALPTERMRITQGGNVGIGTGGPAAYYSSKLVVYAGAENGITIANSGTSGSQYLMFADGTSGNERFRGFVEYAHTGDYMAFATSGTEKMRITSGGNLLINTTTDSGYKLNVNGDVYTSSNYGLNAVGDYAARYRTYAPADGNWGLLTYAADPEYHMVITGASSGDSGANRQFRIYDRPTGNTRFVVNFSNGYTGIGTAAPTRNLHVAGATRHERVYAYANNVLSIPNSVSSGTVWVHLGTQGSFTTDKIYYRVNTNTSEEEGEIIVKNTCSLPNIEWFRNSYNVMVTAVKARMQGGCQPCEIWIQVRYGSDYLGANTTLQWQVHSGTDANFATVNATGTPGTGTNEANLTSTDGYMVSTSNNQSVGGNLGVGTTAPNQRLSVEGGNFAFNSNNAAANYYVYLNKKTGQDGGILFNRDNGNDWQLTNGATTGDLLFYSYGTATEAITFKKGTGNVLIGTTTDAGYKVNLSGDINVSGAIRLAGGGATVTFISESWGINLNGSATQPTQVRGSSFSVGYVLGAGTNYGTGNMFVAGSVGVGELNPTQLLHLTGTNAANNGVTIQNTNASGNSQVRFLNASGVERAAITYINTADAVYMYTAAGGNLLNLVGGNVLIGTTTDAGYKLDVVGDTRITSGSLGVGVAPNATDGRIDASNDIVAYSSSDLRLKENIKPIENALDKVKALTGVEFDWKAEHKEAHGYIGHDTGVIAQEVQEVMPSAVRTNDTGYLAVRYEKLIGLLIEANKELAKRVEDLESKLK